MSKLEEQALAAIRAGDLIRAAQLANKAGERALKQALGIPTAADRARWERKAKQRAPK